MPATFIPFTEADCQQVMREAGIPERRITKGYHDFELASHDEWVFFVPYGLSATILRKLCKCPHLSEIGNNMYSNQLCLEVRFNRYLSA